MIIILTVLNLATIMHFPLSKGTNISQVQYGHPFRAIIHVEIINDMGLDSIYLGESVTHTNHPSFAEIWLFTLLH